MCTVRWSGDARLPARRTLYRVTAKPVLRVADSILGGPLLEDIAEFLLDLRTLYDGLASRARAIERRFSRSVVLVVTTAGPAPLREARRFYEELGDLAVRPRGVLFNRTLPATWYRPGTLPIAPDATTRVLRDNLVRWGQEAHRMEEARREFAARYKTNIATLPWLDEAPTSLDSLAALIKASEGIEWSALTG